LKRSLNYKLSIAFIAIAVTTALVSVFIIFLTSRDRFNTYLTESASESTANLLSRWYKEYGSWEGVEALGLFMQANSQQAGPGMGMGMGRGPGGQNITHIPGEGRRDFTLANPQGRVLFSGQQQVKPGSSLSAAEMQQANPIMVDGRSIGLLLTTDRSTYYNVVEQRLIHNVSVSLTVAMLISILVAGLTGLLFARSLTRPLGDLTKAVKGLAAGEAPTPLEVRSSDEMGELTEAFNQMSYNLEKSDDLRRKMTADVAHDLRTPLTVIGGYVEAVRDGDLEPTAERMVLISNEIEHLNKLVGDLRTLSQADAGELQLNLSEIHLKELLAQAADLFRLQAERKKVSLSLAQDLPGLLVQGDETRLLQVLENLVSNALRHTPAGGRVQLGYETTPNKARVWVEDSGSGIPAEELDLVFERFHRVEKSRHAEENQSGLGLAISKAIIQAHKGRIWAELPAEAGTRICFELPLA